MNTHTPGPWKLSEGEYGELTLVGIPFVDHPDNLEGDLMDGSEGEYLWIDTSDQPDLGQHAHGEANARLIHAAPDLLDACEAAAAELSRVASAWENVAPSYAQTLELVAQDLRATIAKARPVALESLCQVCKRPMPPRGDCPTCR